MAVKRLLVVANPNASAVKQRLGVALGALYEAGFDLDVRQPGGRDELGEQIRAEAGGVDAVLVAGGDGTINAALTALIEAGKPVGVLPLGTANDLALTLGIPTDPIEAVSVLKDGHTRKVDVGRVNGVGFLNVASIGLSVKVAERQDAKRKQQWRVLSYIITTLEVLGDADRFEATIECGEEKSKVHAYQIAVGNGVHYGGGMTIAEGARIDDGLLDVYAIETRSIANLVKLAPAIRAGTHGRNPEVSVFRCASVRIETRKPMPVNTDGEVTTETPADFSVERGALTIFAPREE